MKHTITLLAILAAFSAHATQPGNNGGGHGGCGNGQQTNGCGGTKPTPGGGQGGSSTATANAAAIAAQAQRQAQQQAQRQGQAQALTSTISPTITSTNTLNAAPVKVKVNLTQAAPASAQEPTKTATTEQTVKEPAAAEKAVIVPEAARDVRPVSSAYAPNINPTSPCALTVSGGLQARDLGISFGGTPIADFCEKLEIARSAYNEGESDVAKEVKCGIPAYRAARKRLDKPCAEDREANAKRAAQADAQPTASASLNLLP